MPNVAGVLREEIARVARKEIRQNTETLRKMSAQYRRDVADLKRRVAGLERKVALLEKRTVSDAKSTVTEEDAANVRFSPAWLAKHRKKLDLSAVDYGKLVGVSGQTIYNWENGKARPRPAQVAALAAVRKTGKREAAARLEVLNT